MVTLPKNFEISTIEKYEPAAFIFFVDRAFIPVQRILRCHSLLLLFHAAHRTRKNVPKTAAKHDILDNVVILPIAFDLP